MPSVPVVLAGDHELLIGVELEDSDTVDGTPEPFGFEDPFPLSTDLFFMKSGIGTLNSLALTRK